MRLIGFLLLLVIYLLSMTAQSMAGQVHITGGRVMDLPDGSQLVFDISAPIQTNTFILNNPPRFVIDIDDATFKGAGAASEMRSRDIRTIRTGIHEGRNLRIVVDLVDFVRSKSSIIHKDGYHLVVDIFRKEKLDSRVQRIDITSQPILQLVSRETKQIFPDESLSAQFTKPVIRTTAEPQAQSITQTKTPTKTLPKTLRESSQQQPLPPINSAKSSPPKADKQPKPAVKTYTRDIIVAIDPGHGGKDPGAIGPANTREKDIVMQIARQLKALIDKEPGMRAILTRNRDKYLRLYERIAIARKHRADLFISIHADAFNDPTARGSSVFILSTEGASSAAARWLAQQENQADSIGGVLKVNDDALVPVVLDMVHDAVLADSMDLAKDVLKNLQRINRLHKPKVERAEFAVLKAPEIPSILVETAFISNPDEEMKLRNKTQQQQLAQAIVQGVRAYFDARPQYKELLIATAPERVHIVQEGESLSIIAERYQVSLAALRSINGLDDEQQHHILAGESLTIPGGGS